jgi:pimeloyl-ACP methyl ester carboxylesterase
MLVMGLGGDSGWWERQVPGLSARHRLILVDNRGVGQSDKPAGRYATSVMAADCAAVLEHAGVRRAHVCGLSMGGMIAQELALAAPERIGALVLAATYAKPDKGIERTADASGRESGGPSLTNFLGGGKIDLSGADQKQMFKFLMALVLTPEFIQREKTWLKSMFQRTVENGTTIEQFSAQFYAVMKHDTTARLSLLKLPTLVLTGDADRLVPPHHSDTLARLIPGARLHKVPGGTHGFNVEMPDVFNKAVLDFVAEHPL